MDIKYTYKEPEERPIEKAEFSVAGKAGVFIEIGDFYCDGKVQFGWIDKGYTATFSKQDFADFTDLVNRINRQINGVSE